MQNAWTLFERFGADPTSGCQAVDAETLARHYYPPVNVGWPLAVTHVRNAELAAALRATLLAAYPAEHEVVVVPDAADESRAAHATTLHELDQADGFGPDAALYVAPLPPGQDFTDLQETIAHLRSPVGCPWDREQTLHSLRTDLLSECAEVMEAIDLDSDDRDNGAHIAEELGDVMLIVTMMVQIATDEGRFQMADVMDYIVRKLIRRHPHVFGDVDVDNSAQVKANWDAIKAQERVDNGVEVASPLDGVSAHLPALEKARELQSKAAKAGLLDRRELAYSVPELVKLVGEPADEASVGALLWALTALAKERGVVAENALRSYAVAYRQAMNESGSAEQQTGE